MDPKIIKRDDKKLSLKEMQKLIGGYIEVVFDDGKTQIICNEEGKMMNLPVNIEATNIWKEKLGYTPNDYLAGDVLILENKALME